MWRTSRFQESSGGSYKAMDPGTDFDQSMGLAVSTSIVSHLLRAHNRVSSLRPTDCNTDDDTASTASTITISTLSVIMENQSLSQSSRAVDDGVSNLSQDTLGEYVRSPEA